MLSLVVFVAILVTARMLRLISLVVNQGVEFYDIVIIFLSIVPAFLEIAIPMSALLGVIMAFGRLSADSEIIVMRASGISLLHLVRPTVAFGIATTALTLLVSLYLRPLGNHTVAEKLFELASKKSTASLVAGVFNSVDLLTIYAEEINHLDGSLERVLIDDRRSNEVRQLFIAQRGKIISNPSTRTIELHLADGTIHAKKSGEEYNTTEFNRNRITIDPNQNGNSGERQDKGLQEMGVAELRAAAEIDSAISKIRAENPDYRPEQQDTLKGEEKFAWSASLKKLGERVNEINIEIARKFSIPFAALIFAMLAMPLGIQPARSHRTWGQSLSATLAIIIILAYYGILTTFITIAKSGTISAEIALWTPNVVFFTLAIYTLRKMGSEKWQSILHAFEHLLEMSKRIFVGGNRNS